MSCKTTSPTAVLLRGSRLFALPQQLARPPSEQVAHRTEACATPPHPLYAAIASPTNARAKGDWGLKRSLPQKILRKSEPTVHVEAHDTFDQVTDFSSAARFSKTLKKWQELNLPLSASTFATNVRSGQRAVPKSVFEASYDGEYSAANSTKPLIEQENVPNFLMKPPSTLQEDSEGSKTGTLSGASHKPPTWRYKGPWVLGMTTLEFKEYLQKDVSRIPKAEFKAYLTTCAAKSLSQENARQIRIQEGTPEGGIPPIQPADITPEIFQRFVRHLFSNESLLDSTIADFLNLPKKRSGSDSGSVFDHAISGPPLTHPSAGLTYLRSSARVRNHPTEGPQNAPFLPTEARILNPYQMYRRQLRTARYGLAGFVINGPSRTVASARAGGDPTARYLDIETPGGAHSWVQVETAQILNDGTVSIAAHKPRPQAQEAEEVRRRVEKQRAAERESRSLEEKILTPTA